MAFGRFAQSLVRLLMPFEPAGALYVTAANRVTGGELLREFFAASDLRALLFEGTEEEAFADPRRRPRLEYVAAGECRVPIHPC